MISIDLVKNTHPGLIEYAYEQKCTVATAPQLAVKSKDMRRLFVFLFFLFVLATLAMMAGISVSKMFSRFKNENHLYQGQVQVTAQEWYPYALREAQKWKPDAQFYGIPETQINSQGESANWAYLFYSPEAQKKIQVQISSGFMSLSEITLNLLPIIQNWKMDSSSAALTAQNLEGEKFLKNNPKANILISLFGKIPGTNQKKVIWILRYLGENNTLTLAIDANTRATVPLLQKNSP